MLCMYSLCLYQQFLLCRAVLCSQSRGMGGEGGWGGGLSNWGKLCDYGYDSYGACHLESTSSFTRSAILTQALLRGGDWRGRDRRRGTEDSRRLDILPDALIRKGRGEGRKNGRERVQRRRGGVRKSWFRRKRCRKDTGKGHGSPAAGEKEGTVQKE